MPDTSDACRSALTMLLRCVCKGSWLDDVADVADKWHALMSRPVPKGIKYAKALQRILGHPATLYTVVEYKDVSLFLDEQFASAVIAPLDNDGWRALQAANRVAACALKHDLDRVPTRDEIQKNIQTTKQTRKGPDVGSVSQACKIAYSGIGECLHDAAAAAVAERASSMEDSDIITAWSQMLQKQPDFAEACGRRSPPPAESWTAIPETARHELYGILANASDATAWSHIDHLNGYTNISKNIPSGVMSRIESMATKLAGGLQDGSVKMEALNLQSIGEQVLAGCDSSDLSQLTGNIHELLPVLSQMAPNGVPR